jgi:hypothetical protein
VIDEIFTEGDIVVPLHARRDFKMIYQDQYGKQYYQDLSNSDLVFLNEFYEKLRIREYTFQKKLIFMKRKELMVSIFILIRELILACF